jgi:sugar phosphate isomerase/epimerase
MTLLYHNHDFEFFVLPDGRFALEAIYACASDDLLQTEIDVCWAKTAGNDPAALVRKYPGRAPLVHLKDFSGIPEQSRYDNFGLKFTRPADAEPFSLQPVGRGCQDIPSILAAAEEAGTEWLIVEQDSPAAGDTPMESIAYSATYMNTLLGR